MKNQELKLTISPVTSISVQGEITSAISGLEVDIVNQYKEGDNVLVLELDDVHDYKSLLKNLSNEEVIVNNNLTLRGFKGHKEVIYREIIESVKVPVEAEVRPEPVEYAHVEKGHSAKLQFDGVKNLEGANIDFHPKLEASVIEDLSKLPKAVPIEVRKPHELEEHEVHKEPETQFHSRVEDLKQSVYADEPKKVEKAAKIEEDKHLGGRRVSTEQSSLLPLTHNHGERRILEIVQNVSLPARAKPNDDEIFVNLLNYKIMAPLFLLFLVVMMVGNIVRS